MTPQDAFLQAIAAKPAEDAPRLVYSDWLEEHAQVAFAHFIRVQCEIARQPEENDRWLELKLREEQLWAELAQQWAEHFKALRMGKAKPEEFSRGLLTLREACVYPQLFFEQARNWGFLLGIETFTVEGAMWEDFFASPQLWRVERIRSESCSVEEAALLPFAQAQHFGNLKYLDFWQNGIGPAGIAALARCPSMSNLGELILDDNRDLGDEGVQTLVGSPVCANLVRLELSNTGLTDRGAAAIAGSPRLHKLR